jgi:serralysin
MASTDDTDRDAAAGVFSRAKGGLYGGPVDTTGLDPNVVAQLMGYRWATSFEGTQPAATITYAFPSSTAAYMSDPTYPSTNDLATFQP